MVTAGAANPVGVICDELKKRLQAVKRAERGRGVQLCAGFADGQLVGFVFAELLDRLASVIGMHLERWG